MIGSKLLAAMVYHEFGQAYNLGQVLMFIVQFFPPYSPLLGCWPKPIIW